MAIKNVYSTRWATIFKWKFNCNPSIKTKSLSIHLSLFSYFIAFNDMVRYAAYISRFDLIFWFRLIGVYRLGNNQSSSIDNTWLFRKIGWIPFENKKKLWVVFFRLFHKGQFYDPKKRGKVFENACHFFITLWYALKRKRKKRKRMRLGYNTHTLG